jgi:hypothetical protein
MCSLGDAAVPGLGPDHPDTFHCRNRLAGGSTARGCRRRSKAARSSGATPGRRTPPPRLAVTSARPPVSDAAFSLSPSSLRGMPSGPASVVRTFRRSLGRPSEASWISTVSLIVDGLRLRCQATRRRERTWTDRIDPSPEARRHEAHGKRRTPPERSDRRPDGDPPRAASRRTLARAVAPGITGGSIEAPRGIRRRDDSSGEARGEPDYEETAGRAIFRCGRVTSGRVRAARSPLPESRP